MQRRSRYTRIEWLWLWIAVLGWAFLVGGRFIGLSW